MNDWVAEGVASHPHDFTKGDHVLLLFFQVFLLLHCQYSTETQPGVLYHYTSTNYQLVHNGENLEQLSNAKLFRKSTHCQNESSKSIFKPEKTLTW